VLSLVLQRLGYEVDLANTGEEALAKNIAAYYLIFMDIGLPKMSGLEATKQIRQRGEAGKTVPIVAITAHAMEEEQSACLAAGMNQVVTKPLDVEKLMEILSGY